MKSPGRSWIFAVERRALGPRQRGAEHRLRPQMGEGGLDDEPVEMLGHIVPLFLLAAPPHGDAGDLQLLAQQMAAQHGQERLERQQLDKPAAQRVRNRNGTRAHRLDQPGDAERAVDAKLQRVAVIVIQAAQDDMDGLQPAQRLQEDVPVAHRQVAALDQRDAEVAGQIGVLEIGLVIGAGSQQDDPGIGRLGFGARLTSISRSVVKKGASAWTLPSLKASARIRLTTDRFSSA